MFIKELAQPITFPSAFGPLVMTHEGYEYHISCVGIPQIKIVILLGVMVPGTVTPGNPTPPLIFQPYEAGRVEKYLTGAELMPLRAGGDGKPEDDFRLSDALSMANVGRLPKVPRSSK